MFPECLGVVVDKDYNAVYFSRKAISSKKIKNRNIYFKQGNLFCFKKESLKYFVSLKPSNLEIVESVDMNRLIETRYKIKMIKSKFHTINVDNYKDYLNAKKTIKKDKYFKLYKSFF